MHGKNDVHGGGREPGGGGGRRGLGSCTGAKMKIQGNPRRRGKGPTREIGSLRRGSNGKTLSQGKMSGTGGSEKEKLSGTCYSGGSLGIERKDSERGTGGECRGGSGGGIGDEEGPRLALCTD